MAEISSGRSLQQATALDQSLMVRDQHSDFYANITLHARSCIVQGPKNTGMNLSSCSPPLVCAGRRVTVALARSAAQIRSVLRTDARPFVAASLRMLFDAPPKAFHSVSLNLTALFGDTPLLHNRLFSSPLP